MKRLCYIVAFGFLGLLLSTLVHAVLELVALKVIFGSPDRYAESVWWQNWDTIHHVAGVSLWLAGLLLGLYLGVIWWSEHGSKPGFYHWRKRSR